MYVKHSCLQVLQAFFQDDEPRTGFQDILAPENTIMRKLLGSRINKTDIHLPAVKDVQVVAPPQIMGMSWHEVRTYVEAGFGRGATVPYPVGHPEHLKWTSVVQQKQSDESLAAIIQEAEFAADSRLGEASGVHVSPAFDDIGKDEFQDSQRDMPDSQDSFWKPLIKHEPEHDDDVVVAPGAATSSAAPPSYLLLPDPEAQDEDDHFADADEESMMPVDDPFSQPPDEYAFMAPDEVVFPFHEDNDGEMVDEVAHEDGHNMNNDLE